MFCDDRPFDSPVGGFYPSENHARVREKSFFYPQIDTVARNSEDPVHLLRTSSYGTALVAAAAAARRLSGGGDDAVVVAATSVECAARTASMPQVCYWRSVRLVGRQCVSFVRRVSSVSSVSSVI